MLTLITGSVHHVLADSVNTSPRRSRFETNVTNPIIHESGTLPNRFITRHEHRITRSSGSIKPKPTSRENARKKTDSITRKYKDLLVFPRERKHNNSNFGNAPVKISSTDSLSDKPEYRVSVTTKSSLSTGTTVINQTAPRFYEFLETSTRSSLVDFESNATKIHVRDKISPDFENGGREATTNTSFIPHNNSLSRSSDKSYRVKIHCKNGRDGSSSSSQVLAAAAGATKMPKLSRHFNDAYHRMLDDSDYDDVEDDAAETMCDTDWETDLPTEQRLMYRLLNRYERSVRPVRNASDVLLVRMGLTLTQIFDMVSRAT